VRQDTVPSSIIHNIIDPSLRFVHPSPHRWLTLAARPPLEVMPQKKDLVVVGASIAFGSHAGTGRLPALTLSTPLLGLAQTCCRISIWHWIYNGFGPSVGIGVSVSIDAPLASSDADTIDRHAETSSPCSVPL
jgi:hypothetical protein